MKTWDSNRETINDLWPILELREEERKLWHDDLSMLDQTLLYDALRNVKRQKESAFPQLAWILAAYRELFAARNAITKRAKVEHVEKVKLDIDDAGDRRLADEFTFVIDNATPSEFEKIKHMVLDKLDGMKSVTAFRLMRYARKRLLGQEPVAGKVDSEGNVSPMFSTNDREAMIAQLKKTG